MKKAQVTIYLVYFIVAVIIVVIAGVLAPAGVLFNSHLLVAGEDLLIRANETIQEIDNATIRGNVQGVISTALNAQETNIEVNADIFQYGWVLMLILTALIVFLSTRRIVEVENRGGFVG